MRAFVVIGRIFNMPQSTKALLPIRAACIAIISAACLIGGAVGDTRTHHLSQPGTLHVAGEEKACLVENCKSSVVTLVSSDGFYILESSVKVTIDRNDDDKGSLDGGLTFHRDANGGIVSATQTIRTCQAKSSPCIAACWCGPGRTISITLSADACGPTTTWSGATTADECVCIAGFQYDSSGGCSACPQDSYKSGNGNVACVSCGTGTTSAGGSKEKTDCVCDAGSHFAGGDSPCALCPVGTYTDAANQRAECTACPAFSTTSKEGATSINDCECLADYFPVSVGDGGFTCKAISKPPAPGLPRVTHKTSTTLTVEWDAVSEENGPITGYEVIAEPVTSTGEGSHAEKTEGGVHKAVIPGLSPSTRYQLSVWAYTRAGPTPGEKTVNGTLSAGCDEGMCGPGQYRANGTSTCTACPVGTFQPACAFDAQCSLCPAGTHTLGEGSIAATNCVPCPEGTFSTVGSQCVACAKGFECPPGSSLPTQGRWTEWEVFGPVANVIHLNIPQQDGAALTEKVPSSKFDKNYVRAAIIVAFGVLGIVVIALCPRCACGRRSLHRLDVIEKVHDIVVKQGDGYVDIEREGVPGGIRMRVMKDVNMLRAVLSVCAFITIAALWTYSSIDIKENRYVEQRSMNPVSGVTVQQYDGAVISLADDPPVPTIEIIVVGPTEHAANVTAEVAVIRGGDDVGTGPETNATRFACSVQSLAGLGYAELERIVTPLGEGASMGLGALLSQSEIATCMAVGCLYVRATPPPSAQLYGSPIVTVSLKSVLGVPLYAQHARVRLSVPSWKPGVRAWVTYSRPLPGMNGRASDLSPLGTRSLWVGMMLTRALYTNPDGRAVNIGYDMFPNHKEWEEPAPKQSWVAAGNGTEYGGPLVFGVRFTVASSALVVHKFERTTIVQFLTSLFSFLGGTLALFAFIAAVLIKLCKCCCKKDFSEDPDVFDARNGATASDDDHTNANVRGKKADSVSGRGFLDFGWRKAPAVGADAERSTRALLDPVGCN